MASALSIALRKSEALKRIVKTLGIDPTTQGRDAAMNEAILLERIADALKQPEPEPVKDTQQEDVKPVAKPVSDAPKTPQRSSKK